MKLELSGNLADESEQKFRVYEENPQNEIQERVKRHYYLQHRHQTVAFVRKMHEKWLSFSHARMPILECLDVLAGFLDESDPDLGKECIYPHWGGTKKSDQPTGDLRMGGKVPEELWYRAEDNPNDADKAVTKLSISARSKEKVVVRAKASQMIRWIWRVSSGDVDFSIAIDGREVFSKLRLSTEFHPEIGELKCAEPGEYSFYFDNSHGKIFGKDVKYRIWIE